MYWNREFWLEAQVTVWAFWNFCFCCSVSHWTPLWQKGRSLSEWATDILNLLGYNVIFYTQGWAWSSGFHSPVCSSLLEGNEHGFAMPQPPHSQEILKKCGQNSFNLVSCVAALHAPPPKLLKGGGCGCPEGRGVLKEGKGWSGSGWWK